MRQSEEEGFLKGVAAGRATVPAISLQELIDFAEDDTLCVYGCGKPVVPGRDLCRECQNAFEREGRDKRRRYFEEGE